MLDVALLAKSCSSHAAAGGACTEVRGRRRAVRGTGLRRGRRPGVGWKTFMFEQGYKVALHTDRRNRLAESNARRETYFSNLVINLRRILLCSLVHCCSANPSRAYFCAALHRVHWLRRVALGCSSNGTDSTVQCSIDHQSSLYPPVEIFLYPNRSIVQYRARAATGFSDGIFVPTLPCQYEASLQLGAHPQVTGSTESTSGACRQADFDVPRFEALHMRTTQVDD